MERSVSVINLQTRTSQKPSTKMKLSIAALASVAIAAPGKMQAQGRNQDGGSWSAEKNNKGVFYQEGGESFVAFRSNFTPKGKGLFNIS